MGLFNNIMSKIFSHSSGSSSAGSSATSAPQGAPATSTSAGGGTATATQQQVDVGAVLDEMGRKNPEELDWRHSIVDLMKLVGMDSSLNARKQLASELRYTGN